MRWGFLSTAAINELVLEGARRSDRVDVVAVASRTKERADDYAARHGIARAHGSYESLIADPDVEAIYISTPNSSHVEWTRRALEAGKHVVVEKPATRRLAEAQEVRVLAESSGLVLSEGFMWRHTPQATRLVELVQAGAVGAVVVVRAAFAFDLAGLRGTDDTRFDPALDGGALMDVGCYCVSAIRLLSGSEPARVAAEQRLGGGGVDVATTGTMRMRNGVLGLFECGFVTPHRDEVEVIGEDGSLFVGDPFHARRPGIEIRRSDGVEHVEVPWANSYQLQMENVSDAIRGTAELRLGPDDLVEQARTLEALYASAESFAAAL